MNLMLVLSSAVDLAGFRKVRAKEARPVGACQGCLVLESAPGEEERRRWDLALDLVRALTEEVPGVPSPDLGKQSGRGGSVVLGEEVPERRGQRPRLASFENHERIGN